jgi:hypothetical protein
MAINTAETRTAKTKGYHQNGEGSGIKKGEGEREKEEEEVIHDE